MEQTRAGRIIKRIDPSFSGEEMNFVEQSNLGAIPCPVCGYVGLPTKEEECEICGVKIKSTIQNLSKSIG